MAGKNAPHPVRIFNLKLDRFRNYRTLDLKLDGRHVVLAGDNGAGKTNLLEAISFLSPGRGLRRVPYDKIAMTSDDDPLLAGSWAVNAMVDTEFGAVSIGSGLAATASGPETKRRVTINGTAAPSADTLLDYLRVLWLIPAMDGLFTGPPGDRRRFLDRMVLAIDPLHGQRVNAFERAMRGRNKVLEDRAPNASWLDGIEQQMAESGIAIASARAELIVLLRDLLADHDDLASAFPMARLQLDGTLEKMAGEGASADLEDNYRSLLCRNRARDGTAGRTLEGPHRTDLSVHHVGKEMEAALCSTGEQKALLVGLVLAHARLVATISGMAPLLLLDEIAAHLDQHRRAALFDLIDGIGCQAWMTGTDAHLFDALGERAQHFTVAEGTVSPQV